MSPNLEAPSDVSVRAARALSKRLFGGARYRLEIGRAIAGEKTVNTSELADLLGLSRQSVNQELLLLAGAGLLTRIPTLDSERKVYWAREESMYWEFCKETWDRAGELLNRGQQLT